MAKPVAVPEEEGSETDRPVGTGDANGAVPRRRNYENGHESSRSRRRRLDSLNLDSTTTSFESHVDGGSLLDSFFDWRPSSSFRRTPVALEQETVNEGQELYLHFFHERLRREGLAEAAAQEEARLDEYHDHSTHLVEEESSFFSTGRRRRTRTQSMNLGNFQNPLWRQAGRDLQALADQFARSQEREFVRHRAEQVDVTSLNSQKFMSLLGELFQGGQVTRERILVLFFFCSDVAILAIRCKLDGVLSKLTRWTLSFIREQVCGWVHQNGGWQAVLQNGLNLVQQVAMIGMCAAVITVCVIYVRRSFR